MVNTLLSVFLKKKHVAGIKSRTTFVFALLLLIIGLTLFAENHIVFIYSLHNISGPPLQYWTIYSIKSSSVNPAELPHSIS